MNISFRQFMELRELPGDTLAVIDREFGIGSILQVPASNKSVDGKNYHNMAIYRVVSMDKDGQGRVTGATLKMAKPMPQQQAYFQQDGKMVRNPDNFPEDGKEIHVSRDELMKLFNPEGAQPAQGAAPAGAPPMPGMGM